MSDTEEVIIKRIKPVKNTKPEIAREKLKEKRLRLKAEKEAEIVEKAKQKYADEQLALKQKEAEEEEKRNNDPMVIMMKKIEELQNQLNKPINKTKKVLPIIEEVIEVKKVRKPYKKVAVEEEEEPVKKTVRKKKSPPELETLPVAESILYEKRVKKEVIKPARKQRQNKKVVESPSNIFVGDTTPPNIPIEQPEEPIYAPRINSLHNILMSRRGGIY